MEYYIIEQMKGYHTAGYYIKRSDGSDLIGSDNEPRLFKTKMEAGIRITELQEFDAELHLNRIKEQIKSWELNLGYIMSKELEYKSGDKTYTLNDLIEEMAHEMMAINI